MTMFVQEDRFQFRVVKSDEGLFPQLQHACEQHLPDGGGRRQIRSDREYCIELPV